MYYSHRPTDPYSSEYRLYRDYNTGKDYYRPHTKEYRSAKDYTPRGSRAFDCCSPPPTLRKDDEYDFLPTFGSYIHETSSRGRTRDCQCDCCPHTYQGARRVSEGRYKPSSYEPAPVYSQQRSRSRRRSSAHEREPLYDQRYSDESSRSKRSRKPYEIKVVNQTQGALFREQRPEFYIAFDRDTTTRDVLKLLVGDSKKYRVMVQWDDGVKDELAPVASWRDVRKYAKHLRIEEVKNKPKAKHVHWADQTYLY